MKNLFHSGLLAFALICGFGFVSIGCNTTTPQTEQAVKFNTLKATWVAALAAHDVYCELSVQGKVSAKDQAEINKAWDTFRASLTVALKIVGNDWTKPTPADLEQAKDNLITFILSL